MVIARAQLFQIFNLLIEMGNTLWLCQNSYGKLPFIVDLPIKIVIFHQRLPEGT